jgi:hypothetical protein
MNSQFNGRLPWRAQQILKQAAATARTFRYSQCPEDLHMVDTVLSSAHARVVRLYPEYFNLKEKHR